MRLLRVRLTDFRGVPLAEYRFDGVGVAIVEGPNESGKSSIAEALHLALHYKDSSSHRRVEDVQPEGRDVATEVELEIESGPYHFVLTRRWFKGKSTQLRVTRPKVEAHAGDAAHERVQQILEETVDKDLWAALNVLQGASLEPASIPAGSSLTRALDAAAGAANAGDREFALYDAVEKEYSKYFGANDKPRGELKEAPTTVLAAAERAKAAEERVAQADRDALDAARLTREAHARHQMEGRLEAERAALEARVAEADALRARAELARAQLERQTAAVEDAKRRLLQREAIRESITALAREEGELREAHAEASTRHQELLEAHTRLEAEAVKAEGAAEEARQAAETAHAHVEALHTEFDLMLLKERLTSVTAGEEAIRAANATLTVNAVDRKLIKSIHTARDKAEAARQRLEESGASIRLLSERDATIQVSDQDLKLQKGKPHVIPVTEETRVLVPGFGAVEVTPGSTLQDLKDRAKETEDTLAGALAKARAASVDEAERLHDEWLRATDDVEKQQERIAQALRLGHPNPFPDVATMRAKVDELQARLDAARARQGSAPMTDRDAAKRLYADASAAATRLQDAARDARREAHAAERRLATSKSRESELAVEHRRVSRDLERDNRRLKEELARESDEALSQARATAEALQRQFTEETTRAEASLAEHGLDALNERLTSAAEAVERCREDHRRLRDELARTQERLRLSADSGVGSELMDARGALERANQNLASLTRRAEAVKLLRDTMKQHRDAAQRKYVKPLADRIQALARLVLAPDTQVVLADDLSIKEVVRGGVPMPFHKLSGGTREQLGIIQRLACAMVVAKSGEGVPVIVDDALGYSDPERMAKMGTVFDRASTECQVIVLTCVPDRYARVGKAKVQRTHELRAPT